MKLRMLFIGVLLVFGTILHAQSADEFPALQQQWTSDAEFAENLIANGEETDGQLLDVRRVLDEDRQEISNYIGGAETRVAPLMDQLTALGPVPESGQEAPEVASLRADLTAQIEAESGPLVAARQLRQRINGDIVSIDRLQRQKFSRQLLTRANFPLSVDSLFEFLDDASTAFSDIFTNFSQRWASLTAAGFASSVLPANIAIFLLGMAIIFVGSPYFRREIVLQSETKFGGFVTRKLLSALNVFGLIGLGAWLMAEAVRRTWFVGLDTAGIDAVANFMIACALVALWISRVSQHDAEHPRFGIALILAAIVFGVDWSLPKLVNIDPWDVQSLSVFQLIVAIAYLPLVLRLSRAEIFYGYFEKPENPTMLRATEIARVIFRNANYAIVFLALVGYATLSRQILVATAATIGLGWFGYWIFMTITELGFNIVDRFRADADEQVNDDDQDLSNALWPVVVAIAVFAVVFPFVLVAWGFDANLLLELWVSLVQGFTIGGVHLSLAAVSGFAIVFSIGYFIVKGLQSLLDNFILPRTRMELGARNAIVSLFGYVGFTVVALIAISAAGINLGSLAVIFGALSVGIGFGLQNIVSNFVSGIILLIERPIKKGDWISVSGNEGYVRDISVRATEIETFDRASVIVPNSDLISQPVLNWVHTNKSARVRVPIGVGYDSDPERVREILIDIAKESKWALRIPAPQAVFLTFGDSSLNFELRFHIRDADFTVAATSDANFAIFKRFKEEGIEIPFPIRDVRITQS